MLQWVDFGKAKGVVVEVEMVVEVRKVVEVVRKQF